MYGKDISLAFCGMFQNGQKILQHLLQDFLSVPGHFETLCVNPFHANFPFLYPLKTSENLWFSDVFRGYTNETLARKALQGFKMYIIHFVLKSFILML